MRLARLEVTGLFDQYTHVIDFPEQPEGEPRPSIVILFGPNGVGKTTLLRMLNGLMRLNFDVFRQVPFGRCCLSFTTGPSIEVKPIDKKRGARPLQVSFAGHDVILHPSRPGALQEVESTKVELFRQDFFASVAALSFEFIDTRRLIGLYDTRRAEALKRERRFVTHRYSGSPDLDQYDMLFETTHMMASDPINPKARPEEVSVALAARVSRFIADAQVNYRQFFAVTAPDMFTRLLEVVTHSQGSFAMADLQQRLAILTAEDQRVARLGLEPVIPTHDQLLSLMSELEQRPGSESLRSMVGAYVEMLEARSAERQLVADRLFRFETLMNGFFSGKTVAVDSKHGIRIIDRVGRELTEYQLSSGEFHLLYLMVAALIVRRAGTVMAIDEPEMSMHLAWQRQLVRALSSCATGAEPQFLFATHSPDVAAEYPESMLELRVTN